MNFTQRDKAIASWLAQVGHVIAQRYGCRYFPDLEISSASIIARCCNSRIASTLWQLRLGLIDLGCEFSVYWGWHHDRKKLGELGERRSWGSQLSQHISDSTP